MLAFLPEDIGIVARDVGISRDDTELLKLCLSHEEPVEWVVMNTGKVGDMKGMAYFDG